MRERDGDKEGPRLPRRMKEDEQRKGNVGKMNAVAYCGLACCLCSENQTCSGCQDGGCEAHAWCKNYTCCREKGLAGCWECESFPCAGTIMLTKEVTMVTLELITWGMLWLMSWRSVSTSFV